MLHTPVPKDALGEVSWLIRLPGPHSAPDPRGLGFPLSSVPHQGLLSRAHVPRCGMEQEPAEREGGGRALRSRVCPRVTQMLHQHAGVPAMGPGGKVVWGGLATAHGQGLLQPKGLVVLGGKVF